MFIVLATCMVLFIIFAIVNHSLHAYLILRLKQLPEEYDAAGKPLQLIFINNPIRGFKFSEYILDEQYRWIKDESLVKTFKIARVLLYTQYSLWGFGIVSVFAMMIIDGIRNW